MCEHRGHTTGNCKHKELPNDGNKHNNMGQANMAQDGDFSDVATEINLVSILTDWWVDTRVTKHTCGTKCVFSTYTDS